MIYDISYCQKGLNLNDLPDCERVIIRMGVRDHEDTECRNFISQAIAHDIPFDFYWYICCTHGAAAAVEAKYIVEVYNELCKRFKLHNVRLWFDIEDNNTIAPFNQTFPVLLNKCKSGGIFNMGLYTFMSAIEDKRINFDLAFMEGIPLWLAWHNTKISKETVKKRFPQAVIWQVGKTELSCMITVDYNYKLPVQIVNLDFPAIKLYGSSTTMKYITITIPLWRYDKDILNGRIRVTNSPENIGKLPMLQYVTGWVKCEDWYTYEGKRE